MPPIPSLRASRRRPQPARKVVASVALTWLLMALGASPGIGQREPEAGETFVFERINRTYENEVTEAAPVEQGGITLHLTSPENRVTVEEHSLHLVPREDGTHDATLRVRFHGSGSLEGEIRMGESASPLRDELTVPPQEHTFEGRVSLDRVGEGYLVTAHELPERAVVEIESRLAERLVKSCRLMQVLVPLNCGVLDALTSRAVLPLPGPGATYLLADAELSEEDRRQLDRYLQRVSADRPEGTR